MLLFHYTFAKPVVKVLKFGLNRITAIKRQIIRLSDLVRKASKTAALNVRVVINKLVNTDIKQLHCVFCGMNVMAICSDNLEYQLCASHLKHLDGCESGESLIESLDEYNEIRYSIPLWMGGKQYKSILISFSIANQILKL
mgnify:CR=1 FL=1